MKFFYDVSETDNHWFETYYRHHIDQFGMIEFTYDFCLLYRHKSFEIVKLQIDDILMLTDETFVTEKKSPIKKFLTKSRNCLISTETIKFNKLKIELHFFSSEFFHVYITLCQKMHINEISFIKQQTTFSTNNRGVVKKNLTTNDQYVAQRIRGAYLAFLYQSKVSFDLFYVVQTINFVEKLIDIWKNWSIYEEF